MRQSAPGMIAAILNVARFELKGLLRQAGYDADHVGAVLVRAARDADHFFR